MYIGLLEVTGRVHESASLKDKRRVLKSGQTRIRNKFNLSVAEVDHQDDRQMTTLAIVGVGSDKKVVEQELQQALRLLEQTEGLEIFNDVITYV